jgi:hypothetical protein
MQTIVIRVYPATAAVAYVDEGGQFIKCLGGFKSVADAALSLRGQGDLFVEDCLFDLSNGVRRFRVVFSHGAGTPEYITILPIESEESCPLCTKPLNGEKLFHNDCAARENADAERCESIGAGQR